MKGFLNKHDNPLPDKQCIIEIIVNDENYLCDWEPKDENTIADKGYIGTAKVISGKYKGIGFHAWEQNDYEFINYKIINYGN